MCITFFCLCPGVNSYVKLLLGFNREQQTNRQALKFSRFEEDKNIFGGRDIQSGGTWLGINIATGIMVFLTNYFLFEPRIGKSRGQLVYRFLSTSFITEGRYQNIDEIIETELKQIAWKGQEYSPFNLTICNLRTQRMFYICSEWRGKKQYYIQQNTPYGLCNSDIETMWPKTTHGLEKFKAIVDKIGQMSETEILEAMHILFKDKTRFSQIDDHQASIFVESYWRVHPKVERMTKSTTICLLIDRQTHKQLIVKEVTYRGKEAIEEKVQLILKIQM